MLKVLMSYCYIELIRMEDEFIHKMRIQHRYLVVTEGLIPHSSMGPVPQPSWLLIQLLI